MLGSLVGMGGCQVSALIQASWMRSEMASLLVIGWNTEPPRSSQTSRATTSTCNAAPLRRDKGAARRATPARATTIATRSSGAM